jgi:predicted MFS family arabinose efflux permease
VATFATLLLAPAALLLLAQTPPLAVLGIGVVGLAVAIAICNTLWHTTLQQQVPEESISRVSSYDWMVSLLIFPAGAALAGPLADAFGVDVALFVFAALAGIPLALVLGMSSVRAVRRLDAAPASSTTSGEGDAAPEAAIS